MSYQVTCFGGLISVKYTEDILHVQTKLAAMGIASRDLEGQGWIAVNKQVLGDYNEDDFASIAKYLHDGELRFLGSEEVWTLRFRDGEMEDFCGEILWDHKETEAKEITIPFGDGRSLVAERNPDPDFREFSIGLKDPECYYQDLVIVDQEFNGEGGYLDTFSVKVFSDPNAEDYVGPPILINERKDSYMVSNIDWDTDGDPELAGKLPKTLEIPGTVPKDAVADWLSDRFGFCVKSYSTGEV